VMVKTVLKPMNALIINVVPTKKALIDLASATATVKTDGPWAKMENVTMLTNARPAKKFATHSTTTSALTLMAAPIAPVLMVTKNAKMKAVRTVTVKTLTNVRMINRLIVQPQTHVVLTLLAVPDVHA